MASLPIFVVAIVFFFVYLIVRVSVHERDQRRRMELIERALESGVIDDATKRELLASVASKPRKPGVNPIFLLGWVGLFAGIGMIVLSMDRDCWFEPAILTTAISFGVLSVPLAMRELARKHA